MMSKKVKKLLEEGTVRQFMKYADIAPTYTENFLDTVEEEDEFEPEEEFGAEPEVGMEPEAGMEPGLEPEADVDEELVQRIVTAVADAIEQETGVAVDVAGADDLDMGPEPEAELEPDLEAGIEVEEEPELEMAEAATEDEEPVPEGKNYNREDDELEETAKEEEPAKELEEFDYNSMVAEVARRVALRLVKANK
jgi:pilus assembly protein FimV|tara:strand:- start:200 stop:784 length:585 start_codon:yes stop_codon:yes gene_type:complete